MKAAFDSRAFKRNSYPKPGRKNDAWCSPFAADEAYRLDMELGGRALLERLWHSHQRIMLVAEAHGRLVVRP